MSRVSVKHHWRTDYEGDRKVRETCIRTHVNGALCIEYVLVFFFKGNFLAIQVCGWIIWTSSEGHVENSYIDPNEYLKLAGICWRPNGNPEYIVQRDARKLAATLLALRRRGQVLTCLDKHVIEKIARHVKNVI